jgi:hypothetical protein
MAIRNDLTAFTLIALALLPTWAFAETNPKSPNLHSIAARKNLSLAPIAHNARGEVDIRDLAPYRPKEPTRPHLVAPESGQDLDTIGRDWAERQTRLLTGGAEERLLMEFNRRIDGMITRSIAADHPDLPAKAPDFQTDDRQADDAIAWRPTSLRLTALNKFEMGFVNRSRMSLQYTGQFLQWDLSRSLSSQFELNLRHRTERNSNSLLLNYRW